ncbi:hypothetical protein SDC9_171560 [bioreactor metagenome]|uniref:Uncharacterized protein n=1 Tax=bioreactor metagenome TaxID=1076179 RepID=A0A645GDE2_9ZZZZ
MHEVAGVIGDGHPVAADGFGRRAEDCIKTVREGEYSAGDIQFPVAQPGDIDGARQPGLACPESLLCPLALGDVLMGAEHQQRFAVAGP